MGKRHKTVKFSLLTETEQHIAREYLSLVRTIFSIVTGTDKVAPTVSGEPNNISDNEQFKEEVKDFLQVANDVFSINPKKSTSTNIRKGDDNIEDKIFKRCANEFRTIFRKHFRGVFYLPSDKMLECERKAVKESESRLDTLAKLHEISDRDHRKETLGKNWKLQRDKELYWIREINYYKQTIVFSSIKSEILEDFKNDIQMKFPLLYSGDETHFYDEKKLELEYMEMIQTAKDTFEQDIPFPGDQELVTDMQSKLETELHEKVIDETVRRNSKNKSNANSIMEAMADHAISSYKGSILKVVDKEPLMLAAYYLRHHNELQREFLPKYEEKFKCVDIGMEKLQVDYLNSYYSQTQDKLREVLSQGRVTASSNLVKCQGKNEDILKKCMNDIRTGFEEFKIANLYIEKLQKKFEADVNDVINELEGSSLANPKNIENLLVQTKPKRIFTGEDRVQRESQVINILDEMKVKYLDKVQQILNASKDKMLSKQQHETAKREVVKLLKMEMRNRFGDDMPDENYVESLRSFTDKNWDNADARKDSRLLPTGPCLSVPSSAKRENGNKKKIEMQSYIQNKTQASPVTSFPSSNPGSQTPKPWEGSYGYLPPSGDHSAYSDYPNRKKIIKSKATPLKLKPGYGGYGSYGQYFYEQDDDEEYNAYDAGEFGFNNYADDW